MNDILSTNGGGDGILPPKDQTLASGAKSTTTIVAEKVIANLRLIKNELVTKEDDLATHLKRDMGFLATFAQTFATNLMHSHQRQELMDWIDQIKKRHGL